MQEKVQFIEPFLAFKEHRAYNRTREYMQEG